MRLRKRIPVAAGLGGGSSNAAYFLLGMNRLFRLGLSQKKLARLGAQIGSDVPFFIFDVNDIYPFNFYTNFFQIVNPNPTPFLFKLLFSYIFV